MIAIRQISALHDPHSPLVGDLVRVFRDARRGCLQFLIDLHSEAEDREFASRYMLPANQVGVAEVERFGAQGGTHAGFIAFADGWINQLFIAPEYQGRGIGVRLLDIARQSNPTLQLWCFAANEPAIRFYQRLGFIVVERTDGRENEAAMPDVRMEWRASS